MQPINTGIHRKIIKYQALTGFFFTLSILLIVSTVIIKEKQSIVSKAGMKDYYNLDLCETIIDKHDMVLVVCHE